MSSIPTPTPIPTPTQCANTVMRSCENSNSNAYRCEVGVAVGLNLNNVHQAKRICDGFPGVETCLAEQACAAYFPTSTTMYKACNELVTCMQHSNK